MIARWTRFVDAVAAREDATSYALFRAGVGLGALYTFGSVVWSGLVPVLWLGPDDGGYRALGDGPWLVAALGGPSPGVVWALTALALGASAALAVGVGGRWAAIGALLAATQLLSLNPDAGGSYDQLLTNALWLLVLGRADATLSLSARLRTGRWWPEAEIAAFPRWLAIYQIVLVYWTTGLQKVSAYWVPGGDASALYYILQQPEWQRRDMSFLAYVFPLTQVATTVTWLWEVTAPVWLVATALSGRPWTRRVRITYAALGVAMHALITATMDVGPFSLLSLAFYPALVHPWEWRRLTARA